MSGAIGRIAREEWRGLIRNRAGVIASLLLVALILAAALVSFERRAGIEADRARYQAGADHGFDAQPARHPHRMVHYGQFVFRPIAPLAFFDFGVDSFTGNTIFLEGHRQNSANFAEARQSSLLLRFGQLSPAFLLQTLAPLLLIFLGHASLARERENGTLRLLVSLGVGRGRLLAGKLAGHAGIALAIGAPAFLVLGGIAITGAAPWRTVSAVISGYALWLLFWAFATVLASAVVRRPRDGLLVMVGIWMVIVVLLPRVLPEMAQARIPLPTRIETDIALQRDLERIGDAHDPTDPYFKTFKARVLRRYEVARVENLPVQYAGLVGMEGERLTTRLHARSADGLTSLQAAQNGFVHAFSPLSPLVAIRTLSMALTGSDLTAHEGFVGQSEAFRYRFVQTLNRMQVDKIPNVDAGEDPRIAADNWRAVPRFAYRAPDPWRDARAGVIAPFAVLIGWLVVLALLAVPASRRLGGMRR